MSTLQTRIANLGRSHPAAVDPGKAASVPEPIIENEAKVERYAVDLGNAVGALDAAELMVSAAFALLHRAQGAEKTRSFARRCYWGAIRMFE
jgi:hypothetical protein